MISKLVVFIWIDGAFIPAAILERTGPEWPGAERSSRFQYARSYLARNDAVAIDPVRLPLISGWQDAPAGWQLPPALRDVMPDGWGQHVQQMRHPGERMAHIEFLAGTGDDRIGFLAFGSNPTMPRKLDPAGAAIEEEAPLELAELSEAARRLEDGEQLSGPLLRYLDRGSSLGGARPKATFRDHHGAWVAKFRMRNDGFDEPRVEAAMLDLAEACGIATPERSIVVVESSSTLLVRRFDRTDDGHTRLGYLSAETAMDELSGRFYPGRSYGDLAAAGRRLGSDDGTEIFRRMLLNVLAGNTDDHLRNHAFLRGPDGTWRISPVYDVVPQIAKDRIHVLRLATGHASAYEDAFAAHGQLGVREEQARSIAAQIIPVVARWREALTTRGVSAADIERLEPAFVNANRMAREIDAPS